MPTDDDLVYHYCSAEGLLSILSHTGFPWLTHAYYLNDNGEIRHGIKTAREYIENELKREPVRSGLVDLHYSTIIDHLDSFEEWYFFVACFSYAGDLLSQWRAYADNGRGFAIGYLKSAIMESLGYADLSTEKFRVFEHDVCYDSKVFLQRITEWLTNTNPANIQFCSLSDEDKVNIVCTSSIIIAHNIVEACVFQKSEAFVEEAEWRTACGINFRGLFDRKELDKDRESRRQNFAAMNESFMAIRKFRNGKFGITPYLPINSPTIGYSVRRIVMGPAASSRETEKALRMLLRDEIQNDVEIVRSSASYR